MRSLRYAPVAAVAGFFAALLGVLHYRPLDVQIGQVAGSRLLDGDLHLYAQLPDAQMGPLALALTGGLPRPIFVVLLCAALAVLLSLIEAVSEWAPKRLTVAGLLLAPPWALYAMEGHADDALVIIAAVGILASLRKQHLIGAVLFATLGIAAKPTAIILFPLLLLLSRRALLIALGAAAISWLPFVLADTHGFLNAGRGIALTQPGSLPNLLGEPVGSGFPGWVRPAQLLIGLALTGLASLRIGPARAVLLAMIARTALEPGAWPSYSTAIVALALLIDARRLLPTATLLALASWGVAYTYPLDTVSGLLRLGLLAGVAALALPTRPMLSRNLSVTASI